MKTRIIHTTGDILTHRMVLNSKTWSDVHILLNFASSQHVPVTVLA